jgi:DNA mismatch repair protein MutS2
VVPNDIVIRPPTRTLLVTGPNAGGKTAVLKTVGLCALMVRAGIPLPAAPGSNIPFFDFIFSDIGDSQSLEEDLSTFSGHILRFTNFLGGRPLFSLALLDEILIGTNPDEGSALAQALLEHLSATGGFSVATTHFLSLKSMASEDPRIQNASMGFDPATFHPSYEMSTGLPGASNALQISEQLGLPPAILERAQTLLGQSGREIQDLLLEIQAEKNRAREERIRCEAARTEAEGLERKLTKRAADLEAREKEHRRKYREKLEGAFQEALHDIRKWKMRRGKPSPATAAASPAQAHRELMETRKQLFSEDGPFHIPPPRPPGKKIEDWSAVRREDPVYLADLQTEGRVLEPPDRKGILSVEVKGFRMQVGKENIYRAPARPKAVSSRKPGAVSPGSVPEDIAALERCDLRGMTVDETLDTVSQSLDRAFQQRVSRVVLIHGLGKGVLRDAVRGYLTRTPYACTFRPGRRGEGGDGVTVVEFEAGSLPA